MTGQPSRPDYWSIAALCYLAAPAAVFFGGWLRAPFSLVLVIGLLYTLRHTARSLRTSAPKFSWCALAWLLLLAVAWACLGGSGHLVYANTDWHTRDAVYADLILTPWPPMYVQLGGVPIILRSAIGFYLPPAMLAHLAGLDWAAMILLAWSALGTFLFLVLLPLPSVLGWRLLLASLCVVGFSGMDVLGAALLHGQMPIFPLPIEWWTPWTYTSPTGQLFWAPNHALALWIGTALYMRHRHDTQLPVLALTAIPVLVLWTPFALLGLLPLLVATLLQRHQDCWAVVRQLPALFWLSVALGSYVMLRYLLMTSASSVSAAGLSAMPHASGATSWSPEPLVAAAALNADTLVQYSVFVLCEFLMLAVAIWPGTPVHLRPTLRIALLVLLVLPLFRLGPSNDLLLRASTPSLIVLLIAVLGLFQRTAEAPLGIARRGLIACMLVVGALTPIQEIARALSWSRWPANYGQSLLEQQGSQMPRHYFGALIAADIATLLRPPALVPAAAVRAKTAP